MTSSTLDAFMKMKGIDPNFVDAWGNPAVVSDENVRSLINKMGYDGQDDSALQQIVLDDHKEHWLSFLPAVSVFKQTDDFIFEVCLPIDFATDALIYSVKTEDGKKVQFKCKATDFDLIASTEISGVEFQCYLVQFKKELPLGYHSLELLEKGNDEPLATMSLIIAPKACFTPKDMVEGKKLWGASVQLYCLRSETNWGIGDFSDLKVLLKHTKDNGGDFIGLNPIHALAPSEPENASPYSPSSRKWLNLLYADLEAIDEMARNKALQEKVKSSDFQDKLSALRDVEWVDYRGVTELKLSVLRTLFATLNDNSAASKKRLAKFNAYIAKKDESLMHQASYDALQFKFKAEDANNWGWPVWPEAFKSFDSEGSQDWIRENKSEVLFWCYCQWVTELQIEEADQYAKSLGMTLGLYRDLAVGVGKSSSEVWANQSLYSSEVSVGAPPDVLGPLGQSWGLPPIAPDKMIKAGYKPFIDLLQANMSHCGSLRIDHAMGLLRLWWVPEGETANSGTYIYYAIEDMLNILALESMRNDCLVIGEDLGTVPDGMDVLLKDAGVYSYKVFFFEVEESGDYVSPYDYKEQAMATLSTHDMPTIKGFWHCDDLFLGKELGLYPDQSMLDGLMKGRLNSKQKILNALHDHQSLPENYNRDALYTGMDQQLNFSLQKHVAKGSSSLLSLQLEDFLEMDAPVNVPGTFDEYRNWQRKLSKNLDDIFSNDNIKTLLTDLTKARR